MGWLDVVVGGAAMVPVAMRAQSLGILGVCFAPSCFLRPTWWACGCGVMANYMMHGAIWFYHDRFSQLSKQFPLAALGDHPVDVFAGLEVVAKLLQGGSLLFYLGSVGRAAALTALQSAPAWCWIFLGVSIAAGQTLNFAMYKAIGNAGVYYGFKLGRTVPWAYGFPFNVGLRHPQYVGVVLTLWGALAVLMCPELAALGIPQLVFLWASMYAVMSAMEQVGDNDKKDDK